MVSSTHKHMVWITLTALACGCPAEDDPIPRSRVESRPDASGTGDAGEVVPGEDSGGGGEEVGVEPGELAALSVGELSTSAACVDLEEGERLGAVSPEGHAWMLSEVEGGARVRVWDPEVDPEAAASEVVLELPEVSTTRAWSSTRADMLAGGELWKLDGARRTRIGAPMTLGPDATFCGALGEDGMVLTGGVFYTQREGRWWSWDPAAQTQAPSPGSLLGRDGECFGPDGVMWATSGGTLWELATPSASATLAFDAIGEAAAADDRLAILEGDLLWWGNPGAFEGWRFEEGRPEKLASSGGRVWFMLGEELVRYDGASFERVAHDAPQEVASIHPFHNGAWLVGGGVACQHRVGETLRVEGARPNQRFAEPEVRFSVTWLGGEAADGEERSLTATLDGEAIEVGEPGAAGARAVAARLTPGWHAIELRARRGGAETTRTLHVAHTPPEEDPASWQEDVAPIFEQSCSGGQCHGAGAPSLDLTTRAGWLENASNIRDRVVVTESMPPPAARDGWTIESQNTIERWLDTGMAP